MGTAADGPQAGRGLGWSAYLAKTRTSAPSTVDTPNPAARLPNRQCQSPVTTASVFTRDSISAPVTTIRRGSSGGSRVCSKVALNPPSAGPGGQERMAVEIPTFPGAPGVGPRFPMTIRFSFAERNVW